MAKGPEQLEDLFRHTLPEKSVDIVESLITGQLYDIDEAQIPLSDGRVSTRDYIDSRVFEWSMHSFMPSDQHYDASLYQKKSQNGCLTPDIGHISQQIAGQTGSVFQEHIRVEYRLNRLGNPNEKFLYQMVHVDNIPREKSPILEGVHLNRSVDKQTGVIVSACVFFQFRYHQEMKRRLGVPKRYSNDNFNFYYLLPDGRCAIKNLSKIIRIVSPEQVRDAGLIFHISEDSNNVALSVAAETATINIQMGKNLRSDFAQRMFAAQPMVVADTNVDIQVVHQSMLN